MRRHALILSMPLLLAALGGCNKQPAEAPQPAPVAETGPEPAAKIDTASKGKAMPTATFQDPADAPVTLAALKGKPVLLNLWATWCAPCVKELPTLDALAAASGDRLIVLAVSEDLEGRRVVEPFFAKRGYRALKPYGDKANALMLGLKEASLPATVFYGADGRELWRVHGGMNWTGAQAKALLAEGGV